MTSSLFIGIEGGATRATAVALDEAGREVARSTGDAIVLTARSGDTVVAAVQALIDAITSKLDAPTDCGALSCNLTGAGRPDERRRLGEQMQSRGLARRVAVGTDAEAALADAFEDGPGLLLIAGTGSIAFGRAHDGRTGRVGGWGPIAGDEGSAWAIGQGALRAVLAAHDGRGEATALTAAVLEATGARRPEDLVRWAESAGKKGVAALAPLVVEHHGTDAASADVVNTALTDLEAHVMALARRLEPWPDTIPLALAGGLLATTRPLRSLLASRIRTRLPAIHPLERDVDGARGAAWLAHRLGTR